MKMISTENINQNIQLRPLPASKQVFDGRTIILELANLSNQLIEFPTDYGIRLFVFDPEEKQWVEIPNLTEYRIVAPEGPTVVDNEEQIVLYPFGSPFEKPENYAITADPNLEGVQRPITLRIVVLGMLGENQSEEEKFAAYYDVYIDQ